MIQMDDSGYSDWDIMILMINDFKIVDGKLLAHDVGLNGYPDDGVAYKSKTINVENCGKVQISFDLWKWSM